MLIELAFQRLRGPYSTADFIGSRGHHSISLTALLVLCIGILPVGREVHADPRLEIHRYGNIGERQFNEGYPDLGNLLVGTRTIPGLHRNFVPQGIEFLDSGSDEVVLSGYFCERFSSRWRTLIRRCVRKRSAFYLFDLEAGEPVRLALLTERDGEPMRRHAAGVAELYGRLWLPDFFQVFRFDLSELRGADESVITMRPENEEPIGVDSSGDFITAFKDSLWIGNFQRGRRGAPLPVHYRSRSAGTQGWTAGYRIDPDTLRPASQGRYSVTFGGNLYEVHRPDAAFHHGSKVQGMSFLDEHRVVLSTSYGPGQSVLAFHRLSHPPLRQAANGEEMKLPDGSLLRVQTLGITTQQRLITAPPGAEGVTYDGRRLAVAFEGGALPYRNRWQRIEDRILMLQISPILDQTPSEK